MSIAGPMLKRVTLELGGSDPVIVCEDADVDAAVKAVIIGRYWNAGQACLGLQARVRRTTRSTTSSSASSSSASGATSRATARSRPRSRGCGWARSTRARAATSCVEQLEDGVAKGGELLIGGGTGGHDKGWFLEPAVVAEPGADSRLVHRGGLRPGAAGVPLHATSTTRSRRANDTPYGLGSSIWTHDVRKIHRAAQEIDAGMTWVNQIHYGYDELPFGGVKDSGFGKEHGLEALDSYVELKSRRRRRAGLMAVTYAAEGAVGTITLDNPPANSYDIDVHARARRRGRRGDRRRDGRAWSSCAARARSSSARAPTSSASSPTTSTRTWR